MQATEFLNGHARPVSQGLPHVETWQVLGKLVHVLPEHLARGRHLTEHSDDAGELFVAAARDRDGVTERRQKLGDVVGGDAEAVADGEQLGCCVGDVRKVVWRVASELHHLFEHVGSAFDAAGQAEERSTGLLQLLRHVQTELGNRDCGVPQTPSAEQTDQTPDVAGHPARHVAHAVE